MQYFIKTFEESVKSCWNSPALNDYKNEVITYGELAKKIETMHLVWRAVGLKETAFAKTPKGSIKRFKYA